MNYDVNMKALQNLLYTFTRLYSEMAGACAVAHSELQKCSELPSEECVPSAIVERIEAAEQEICEAEEKADYVKDDHVCSSYWGGIPTQADALNAAREIAKDGMPIVEYYEAMRLKFLGMGLKALNEKGMRHYLYRVGGSHADKRAGGRRKRYIRMGA